MFLPGFPPLCDNWSSAFNANNLRSKHNAYIIGKGQLLSFSEDNNLQKFCTDKAWHLYASTKSFLETAQHALKWAATNSSIEEKQNN